MPVITKEEKERRKKQEQERLARGQVDVRTPQEIQAAKSSAQEFLRRREKLRGKGATTREATAQTVEEERARAAGELATEQAAFAAEAPLRQEEILERERLRREGEPVVEELPPEELPPVTAPAVVEPGLTFAEKQSFLKNIFKGVELPEGEKLAMGTLPINPAGVALNTAKVVTSTRAVKAWNGVLKVLKTNWKKLAKWTAIGYALWSERSIGNMDSALSQVRESITLPVSLAASNPFRIPDAYDMITDLEEDVREYESDVKLKEIYSPTFKLTGRTRPIYQRIKKLDVAIDLARTQIARIEATGAIPTDEETIIMLDEINKVLGEMENPSKFLGII